MNKQTNNNNDYYDGINQINNSNNHIISNHRTNIHKNKIGFFKALKNLFTYKKSGFDYFKEDFTFTKALVISYFLYMGSFLFEIIFAERYFSIFEVFSILFLIPFLYLSFSLIGLYLFHLILKLLKGQGKYKDLFKFSLALQIGSLLMYLIASPLLILFVIFISFENLFFILFGGLGLFLVFTYIFIKFIIVEFKSISRLYNISKKRLFFAFLLLMLVIILFFTLLGSIILFTTASSLHENEDILNLDNSNTKDFSLSKNSDFLVSCIFKNSKGINSCFIDSSSCVGTSSCNLNVNGSFNELKEIKSSCKGINSFNLGYDNLIIFECN